MSEEKVGRLFQTQYMPNVYCNELK